MYANGSETRVVGHGAATRHYCPTCGTPTKSCINIVRHVGRLPPEIDVKDCEKCHWRFRCFTNGW